MYYLNPMEGGGADTQFWRSSTIESIIGYPYPLIVKEKGGEKGEELVVYIKVHTNPTYIL